MDNRRADGRDVPDRHNAGCEGLPLLPAINSWNYKEIVGIITPGNRSYSNAENSGKSSFKNLGILESLIALISTTSSDRLLSALFNDPAITSNDFTALIPKS